MSKKNKESVNPVAPAEAASVPDAGTKIKVKKPDSPEKSAARRNFMKTSAAAGIGACALGTPLCAAVQMILSPVFAEKVSGKFYPLTTVDALTEHPVKFSISDQKKDAWATLPDQKIGSLFLRKSGDKITALHALCPHAGCMIQTGIRTNPQTKEQEEMFYCPCHAAHFDLDGKRLDGVSPRDMDSLEVNVENNHVLVKFENFTFGTAAK
ncbi:MAG: Rieske (2Fe-2S) protein [Planctomycetaceae bacterium]|jgi:nitrite reductase/ring-hydroxylating ferredoxin subunit|nr:Rieske (2Fe-2S) protein [Planctomycetaceae bacterium]